MTQRHNSMRPASGSTIVELLITLVVVSIAMAIASVLMFEAQKRSVLEMSRMMDPAITLAVQRLKADMIAAGGSLGDYHDEYPDKGEPLSLILPSGTISYELSGGELRRIDGLKEPQALVVGVTEFSWTHGLELKPPAPGLLRVDLEYEVGHLGGPAADGKRNWQPRRLERRTLRVKMRGGGGAGW